LEEWALVCDAKQKKKRMWSRIKCETRIEDERGDVEWIDVKVE
jgi:hypothetical protein